MWLSEAPLTPACAPLLAAEEGEREAAEWRGDEERSNVRARVGLGEATHAVGLALACAAIGEPDGVELEAHTEEGGLFISVRLCSFLLLFWFIKILIKLVIKTENNLHSEHILRIATMTPLFRDGGAAQLRGARHKKAIWWLHSAEIFCN